MTDQRLYKLGIVKKKVFDKEFDAIYDQYKIKAELLGYDGEIKFIRERSKILIYVEYEFTSKNS